MNQLITHRGVPGLQRAGASSVSEPVRTEGAGQHPDGRQYGPHNNQPSGVAPRHRWRTYAACSARSSFLKAFFSSWRMRSADTS